MSRRYFVTNGLLTVFVLSFGGGLFPLMFLPMICVINTLTQGQKTSPTGLIALALSHPWLLPIVALALAAAGIVLASRGVRGDIGRRPWWIAMIVFDSASAVVSLMVLVMAPKLASLFQDVLR